MARGRRLRQIRWRVERARGHTADGQALGRLLGWFFLGCLAGLVCTLWVACRRTPCALACADEALAQVEREASSAAQALAEALTESDPEDMDKRDAGLKRGLASAQALAERFPQSGEIREAVATLTRAREEYLQQRARRTRRQPGTLPGERPGRKERPGGERGARGEERGARGAGPAGGR